MEEPAASGLAARGDLRSALPFLPVVLRGGALFWPPAAQESLRALALGPDVSRVASGDVLADALTDLRLALALPALPPLAADGLALFFDDLLSRAQARGWFSEVVPNLARLLLRLPILLEDHYAKAGHGASGLRVLASQDVGLVLLSQEFVAALLTCALFCLFPTAGRDQACLPTINFDGLFTALIHRSQSQEQKVRCLVHYFERVTDSTPTGFVSFERKVLPRRGLSDGIPYPDIHAWLASSAPLCQFRVFSSGFIEDEEQEALQVDFANKYLGGGALSRGCVQEEIRFMINPELIVGMLFMASMEDNEAIEIFGAERFSQYMGYGSSFRFVGDYLDTKPFDSMGRRRTRIVAIDALDCPAWLHYESGCLLREVNKAFCGFFDQSKHQLYVKLFQDSHNKGNFPSINSNEYIGVSTGNWGCGAFGGNPEIKSMIQWIAASQALRPFVNYYTFEDASLERLEEVIQWILRHGWTVGELWHMLIEYSSQRLKGETYKGFFAWLLPNSRPNNDTHYMSDE
ncbi:poly(ADP-ribose) glycohydrolase 1-like [Miscanthus floridulus]|uniref:poly(ADP-ribose) glycohydrolase 1-like n=1 Tax=Miscanthus floridulus TaxID=154761 RepID=UPI003458DE5E